MRSYIICRLLIAALGVLLDGAFVRGDGGADRSNSSPEESSSPDLTNAPYFYVQDKVRVLYWTWNRGIKAGGGGGEEDR